MRRRASLVLSALALLSLAGAGGVRAQPPGPEGPGPGPLDDAPFAGATINEAIEIPDTCPPVCLPTFDPVDDASGGTPGPAGLGRHLTDDEADTRGVERGSVVILLEDMLPPSALIGRGPGGPADSPPSDAQVWQVHVPEEFPVVDSGMAQDSSALDLQPFAGRLTPAAIEFLRDHDLVAAPSGLPRPSGIDGESPFVAGGPGLPSNAQGRLAAGPGGHLFPGGLWWAPGQQFGAARATYLTASDPAPASLTGLELYDTPAGQTGVFIDDIIIGLRMALEVPGFSGLSDSLSDALGIVLSFEDITRTLGCAAIGAGGCTNFDDTDVADASPLTDAQGLSPAAAGFAYDALDRVWLDIDRTSQLSLFEALGFESGDTSAFESGDTTAWFVSGNFGALAFGLPDLRGLTTNGGTLTLTQDGVVAALIPEGTQFSATGGGTLNVVVTATHVNARNLIDATTGTGITVAQRGADALPASALAPPPGTSSIGASFYAIQGHGDNGAVQLADGEVTVFLTLPRTIANDALRFGQVDGLTVAHYDAGSGRWVALPSAFDATAGQMVAIAEAFGFFRVLYYPVVTQPMLAGWNAIAFSGADGTPVERLAALLDGAANSIWRFQNGTWTSWQSGLPASLYTLMTLNQGDALFVNVSADGALRLPDTLFAERGQTTVGLQTGANFLTYTGPDGDFAEILGAIEGLEVAFVFNALEQQWAAYRPGPAFLSDIPGSGRLGRLAPLFLIASSATSWTFPAL